MKLLTVVTVKWSGGRYEKFGLWRSGLDWIKMNDLCSEWDEKISECNMSFEWKLFIKPNIFYRKKG